MNSIKRIILLALLVFINRINYYSSENIIDQIDLLIHSLLNVGSLLVYTTENFGML